MLKTNAYDQGARSYHRGGPGNPYRKGSADHVRWKLGYDHARLQDDAESIYFQRAMAREA